MLEADLKRAVNDYLQWGRNQHKWVFFRLNSGSFVVGQVGSQRMIKGCGKGTADYLIIWSWHPQGAPNKADTLVLFLELKSTKGKTSKAQDEFAEEVRTQGAGYKIIRNVDELIRLMEG